MKTMNDDDYINLKMGDRISFFEEDTGTTFKARIFEVYLLLNPETALPRIEISANKETGNLCVILDD